MTIVYALLGKVLEFILDWGWRKWKKSQAQQDADEKIDEAAKASVEKVENAKTPEAMDQADSDLLSGR